MTLKLYSATTTSDASGLPNSPTSDTLRALAGKISIPVCKSFIGQFTTKREVGLFIEQEIRNNQCIFSDIDSTILEGSQLTYLLRANFETANGDAKATNYFLIINED